jgi:hypothetical protein
LRGFATACTRWRFGWRLQAPIASTEWVLTSLAGADALIGFISILPACSGPFADDFTVACKLWPFGRASSDAKLGCLQRPACWVSATEHRLDCCWQRCNSIQFSVSAQLLGHACPAAWQRSYLGHSRCEAATVATALLVTIWMPRRHACRPCPPLQRVLHS